jgi:hypothetical protein
MAAGSRTIRPSTAPPPATRTIEVVVAQVGRVIGSVCVSAVRKDEPAWRHRPVQCVEKRWRCFRPAQEPQVVPRQDGRLAGIAFGRGEVVNVTREGVSYTASAACSQGSGADVESDHIVASRLKDQCYAASSRADVEDAATAPFHRPPVERGDLLAEIPPCVASGDETVVSFDDLEHRLIAREASEEHLPECIRVLSGQLFGSPLRSQYARSAGRR